MAESQDTGASSGKGPAYTPFFSIKGRNGYDDAFTVPQEQCADAKNVDWYGAALGRRRGGSAALSITGGTAFGSGVRFLTKNVPGADQSAAELFGLDGAGLVKRLAGGTSWADVTLKDAITGNYGEANAIPFNGKLFFCCDTAVNRLHCWDGNTIRRVGLPIPASAPTAGDVGGGAYAAVTRYYKIAWIGPNNVRSELSAAVGFTPSGGGSAAQVTRPAAPGEQETGWIVYGSLDNANYFTVNQIGIGSTTYNDSADPYQYSGATPSATGAHLPPPSAKYIVSDDARLIMGGAWETSGGEVTPYAFRIWWTPTRGASNQGDDERIEITDTIEMFDDLDQPVTGISQPVQGAFFAFSYEGQWLFTLTGDVTDAYKRTKIGGGQGCISHKSIIVAHDDAGYPSTYWMSKRGIERTGKNGNQFCSPDITDIWATVNQDATTLPHGIYHQDIHQIWWYIATGVSNTPTIKLVFDTWLGQVVDVFKLGAVRGGWSLGDGEAAKAYCSVMFSSTVGASMSKLQKPYIGYVTSTAIWKCDTADQDDAGNAFRAYIESKPYAPWGLARKGGMVQEAMLIAVAQAGVTIQLELIRDQGAETTTSTCSLAPISTGLAETHVFPQFEASMLHDAKTIKFRIGDASAVSSPQWLLDALISPMEPEGPV